MVFDKVVGHERTLEPLRRALAEDRLHHSLLFHGPEGVGKRLAGFTLAAALQCPTEPGEGCGTCPSCRRVLQGYEHVGLKDRTHARAQAFHADVLYYPPRRRQIQIDQIQDLCREAGYRPFEGRRRVFLVDPAERMNREASNALLKTLEEPPPSTLLILVTAHAQGLLPTLRSRCQDVRFAPLQVDDLARLLASRGHGREEAARIARLAEGSVGRAVGIDLERHDALRERILALLEAGGQGTALGQALGLAEEAGASAETFDETASLLASVLRDLALVGERAGREALVHADVAPRLERLAPRYGQGAPAALGRLAEAGRRVRGNVNPRIAAEAMLVGLLRPERAGKVP